MNNTVKFILAVFLAAISLTSIAVSAVKCGEIMGGDVDPVVETLLIVLPFGLIGFIITFVLVALAVCDERDNSRKRNTLPKRREP